MIYVTGDVHGNIDINKLSAKNWPIGNTLTHTDYLIVCGDFGLIWDDPDNITAEEKYWLEWLSKKPWTTLFVDGNHENHDRLATYPVEEMFGGKVHRITPNIIHLMRGEYYEIDGRTFWCMGGATSTDKHRRTEGKSWWRNELPSIQELNHGIEVLRAHDLKVDYIITHCAPRNIQEILAHWYENDGLTSFLNLVLQDVEFKRWFCGHYHIDKEVNEKFVVVYDNIIPLPEVA